MQQFFFFLPFAFICLLGCFITYLQAANTSPRSVCFSNNQLCFSAMANLSSDLVTMTITTTLLPQGWVSIGLGSSMANANVWILNVDNDGTAQITDRLSTGYSLPSPVSSSTLQLLTSPSQVKSSPFTLQFTRPKASHEFTFTNSSQSFIWALSEKGGSSLSVHSKKGVFFYNAFTSSGSSTSTSSSFSTWISRETAIKWHKYTMIVAWNLMAGIGIFVARFFKSVLPQSWFRIHVITFSLALMLAMVGFIFIVMSTSERHFHSTHGILGLMVVILMIMQLMLGVFIHFMFDPKRFSIPLRDRLHWGLGYLVYLLAALNVFLGLMYMKSNIGWFVGCALVYVFFVVAFIWGQVKLGQTHELGISTESSSKF